MAEAKEIPHHFMWLMFVVCVPKFVMIMIVIHRGKFYINAREYSNRRIKYFGDGG